MCGRWISPTERYSRRPAGITTSGSGTTTGEGLRLAAANLRPRRFQPGRTLAGVGGVQGGAWDPRSGLIVVRLQGHEGPVTAALFDESGRRVVTGGVDGIVRTYDCDVCGDLDELLAIADRRLAVTGRELTAEERKRYLG